MKMEGQQFIPAPREQVWEALNDPEILKQSLPGCDSVEKTSDTEFHASLTAKVGPVKAKFKGQVTLSDLDPPKGYTLSGEGKGGAAGFGKGDARVTLSEQDGGTLLTYHVEAKVGGKLAQIGSRLVDSAAKKMADDFFANFNHAVAPESAAEAEPAEAEADTILVTEAGVATLGGTETGSAGAGTTDAEEPSEQEKARHKTLFYLTAAAIVLVLALYLLNLGQ